MNRIDEQYGSLNVSTRRNIGGTRRGVNFAILIFGSAMNVENVIKRKWLNGVSVIKARDFMTFTLAMHFTSK